MSATTAKGYMVEITGSLSRLAMNILVKFPHQTPFMSVSLIMKTDVCFNLSHSHVIEGQIVKSELEGKEWHIFINACNEQCILIFNKEYEHQFVAGLRNLTWQSQMIVDDEMKSLNKKRIVIQVDPKTQFYTNHLVERNDLKYANKAIKKRNINLIFV